MINDLYIPTPLEDYPEKERLEICKSRIDSYIEQQYREGGLGTKVPNESSKVRTRMDRISYCRSLWNNNIDEQRYDYLYNKIDKTISDQDGIDRVITMEMPAKVRHIPIVRPKLQALISKELSRPLVMKTVGIDEAAVNKKIQEEIDGVWIKQMEKFAQRRAAQQAQQMMLQQQQQLMQQIQEVPGAEGMIIEMQSQLEMIAEIVNKEAALTEEEVKKIRKYYKYNYKLFEEDLADSAIKEYIDRHSLRRLKNDAFTEQMITGEPIYFCDWEDGMDEPQTRLVRPEFYWYQYNSGAKFLKDLDWCVEYIPMTFGMIVQQHGKYLSKKDLDTIRDFTPYYSQDAYYRLNLHEFPNGTPNDPYYKYDSVWGQEVDTYLVYWKEQAEVYALYTENNNEAKYMKKKPPFVKFISAEEARKMTDTDNKLMRLKRKGQTIKKAYRTDLYKGIRIGPKDQGIYIRVGKVEDAVRPDTNLSSVDLPYVGFANNRFYQSYSLMWETRDIQELYNILHYQEELLVALAGVKGIVYDLSQMPTDMSPQEVMYYMKHGVLPIETLTPDGKPKRTSFNQFSQYDQTVSPAISTIDAIKRSLDELVGQITGSTRQQTGQVAATDQVGTTQIALQQSNVVTEYYFQIDEELWEQFLTRLANLFPLAYAEGKQGVYSVGKERQEILRILKNQLKGQFRVYVNSGAKEREIAQNVKQIATNKFASKEISTIQLVELLNTDLLSEMMRKLEQYEKEAQEIAQRRIQEEQQMQKQAQMEMQQLSAQIESQMKQMEGQIKMQLQQMKSQADIQIQQMKQQESAERIMLEKEKINKQAEIEMYKADQDTKVEMDYLQFQYTELQVNNATQRAQMLINKAQKAIEISKAKSKERIKD